MKSMKVMKGFGRRPNREKVGTNRGCIDFDVWIARKSDSFLNPNFMSFMVKNIFGSGQRPGGALCGENKTAMPKAFAGIYATQGQVSSKCQASLTPR